MTTTHLEIVGRTPLLMHAPVTVDPIHPVSKQMAAITQRTKASQRSEEEHKRLAELEWHAGLYLAPGLIDGPVVPTANIKRCLSKGAFYTGGRDASTNVTNALDPSDMFVALAYEGPRDPDELYASGQFADRRAVKGGGTVMRTRPKFYPWALTVDFELDEGILDFSLLAEYAHTAGKLGLLDGRKIGFGRFNATASRV